MIQRDPTFTEDAGKGSQPQTPLAAALTVVPSLYLAQQGGAEWPGWVREGMGCRIRANTERAGRRADDRGAMNSCYRISQPSN